MAEYLVQTGAVRRVVRADDARKAAIWTVHLVMELDVEDRIGEGRLGRRIRVLRTDGLEAGSWPTYEILLEWSQLLAALDRLEQVFGAPESQSERMLTAA